MKILWAVVSTALTSISCDTSLSSTERDPLRSEPAVLSLPADPAKLAALIGSSPDSLLSAGQERYQNQSFDSARAIWNVELNRAVASRDARAEARVRMWLGIVAWKLSDYKTAEREGTASVSLKRQLGMDDELSRSFNALGLLAWHEGRLHDALVFYDSAIAAARRHDDASGVARASANIPLVRIELGRFDEARADFSRALEASEAAGDSRTQGNLLANMGMLEIRLGNPSKGITLLREARSKYSDSEVSGQANALGQLATAWGALGELQRAIAAADSAIIIARSEGLQQEVAANLEVMADLEMQAGNPRLALASLRAADSIDAELGLRSERGTNLRRSAIILLDLGETNPAVSLSYRALDEHKAVDAANEVVLDRLQLATALARAGRIGTAEAQMDTAQAEAKTTGNPATVREAFVVAATLALESGKPRLALAKLPGPGPTDAMPDWRVPHLRSVALFASGRHREARAEGQRALDLVERERASLGAGPLRSGYFAAKSRAFSHMVAVHLALRDTASAFDVAAALPGRSLAERIGRVDDAGLQLASLVRSERLLAQAGELERQIAEAQASQAKEEQLSALRFELSRARTAYEKSLAESAPVPRAEILGGSKQILRQIQSTLGKTEAVLLYLSGEERLDLFVVRRTRLAHRSSPINARQLSQKVRVARESLQRFAQSPPSTQLLGELHGLLITPLADDLRDADRVIVIPHASLAGLPFAALWHREAGQFLVEEKTISYAPTAAAISVGIPSTVDSKRDLSIFAPTPEKLPGTEREARTIARLVKGAKVYLGRQSTKSSVRSALARGDVVHIASHGSHNSQNPLFSHMTVASAPRKDGNETLAVHEIVAASTRTPLVFLSGCDTGLSSGAMGAFSVQSDENSLSQAFLFAGASNVVATLWPVTDSEAALIAGDFYRGISSGYAARDALAAAQRRAIRRGGQLTWAAYTVSGVGGANSH